MNSFVSGTFSIPKKYDSLQAICFETSSVDLNSHFAFDPFHLFYPIRSCRIVKLNDLSFRYTVIQMGLRTFAKATDSSFET